VAEWPLPLDVVTVVETKWWANKMLADDARERSELDLARKYFTQTLALAEKLGKPRLIVISLLELSDLAKDDATAQKHLQRAISMKDDDAHVAKEFSDFYYRRTGYRARAALKVVMDEKKRKKDEVKRLKEERRKIEEAAERESDRKSDLRTEQLKKSWSEVLIPEN